MSTPITITSLDDPRVADYVNLTDRILARREAGLFVAEGHYLVDRLLDEEIRLKSILTTPDRHDAYGQRAAGRVPIYLAEEKLLSEIVGFSFHRGVIAVGYRPSRLSLDAYFSRDDLPATLTLAVCPNLTNVDNLGLIARTAAGLGADALLLGQRCCDPWYRRCVRTSMGTIFSLPVIQSDDIVADLNRLRADHGFEVIAAALSDRAEPLVEAGRGERVAVMFGEEGPGLTPTLLALADRHVMIPMGAGVDSLNVAVSAGIILHHFITYRSISDV